ncbi:TlpA disulfide reductase family protein [uncultured Algibacter sp.]|uniref:TlpA family protein disulfide reductase n=1 Tax=uncultured Algibacter sp. TaxID=298659 RepID=UPI0032167B98
MKHKFSILLVSIILIYACKNESKQDAATKKEYALVSGKVTNYNGFLKLINKEDLHEIKHEIKISDNGTFEDTIYLKQPKEYLLENAVGQSTNMYLSPGAQLHIKIDGDNLGEGVSFSGNGAIETNYLIHKKTLLNSYSIYPNLKKETTEEIVANLEKRHVKMLDYLDTKDGLTDAFKENEKKRLHYTLLNSLSEYTSMTRNRENPEGYALPEKYSTQISNIPMDREADYRLSESYRRLVSTKIVSKVRKKINPDTNFIGADLFFEEIKKIPNEYIMNEVAFSQAQGSILFADKMTTERLQNIYDDYMGMATDEKRKKDFMKIYESKLANAPGSISPKFENYENYKGGKTSLDDFKGQYVFIDVWATWCTPCKAEIPFLEKLEKKYHNKNITFVSISVDAQKDYDKWKRMIKDKNMAGIQLFADKDFDSEFIKAYNIFAIPRFILIDSEGKIINSESPKPSEMIDTNWMEEQGI